MHYIKSAAIPPKVVTAVSGVSTPSSAASPDDGVWIVSFDTEAGPVDLIAFDPEKVLHIIRAEVANTFTVQRIR